ncbi:MAG TPA: hypothetical protein IAD02_01440 [Candidatus Enterousia intestinigallinarum]|uniref:Uncharacterized protein n=1 Tax=Candidatus Enterousia intestinigallinarum TaxID=2840790 RepID=A0A9D1FGD6_9PROT|nr:hypothetical protein [Candidatus Enterousia intestinigallinarum]
MNTDTILRLLQNSGFHILGADGTYLYLEDPSCILRSFETFIEYAWIVIVCITGLLLFGWAISMIRGAKNDIFTNLRNLLIMFGTLSAAVPIVNMIWGDDLFARGCRTIRVSIDELNTVLDAQNLELSKYEEFRLYENIDIYDSGAMRDATYADAPLAAPSVAPELNDVTVSGDTNTIRTPGDGTPREIGESAGSTPAASRTRPARTSARRPARATAAARDVVYTNADGTQYRHTGGSRAWRNNNPGNIRYSEFARRVGAIGEAGGFAVFPDEETGMRAIGQLLRSDSYNRLTVAGAISRYAPPSENNTAAYHRRIQELTGLSINRRMSELNDAELARVVGAIRQIEGWQVGRVVEN